MRFITTLALVAVFLSGCSTMDPNAGSGEKVGETTGALGGAALGAILGNMADCKGCALIGGVIGAAVGSQVGRNIGATMDREDRQRMNSAIHRTPSGQTVAWQNPDSGTSYSVTPTKTYDGGGGKPCREFILGEKQVGGEKEQVYTNACYDGHGGWVVQPK